MSQAQQPTKRRRRARHRLRVPALLVEEARAAAMLGYSSRHFRNLHTTGRCPLAIRALGDPRWSVRELRAWVDAGCPVVEEWEERKRIRKVRAIA